MIDPSALAQQHAAAIITALVDALDAPDGRDRLRAAKLLLLWGWGPARGKRRGAAAVDAVPDIGLSAAEQQRAVDLLLPHLRPAAESPNRAATSCPARHDGTDRLPPGISPHADSATNPMSLEPAAPAGAVRATTPCPAAAPPPDPRTHERSLSPLAAPPGTDSPRRDADPMSRALLPARHSDDAFRRRLPQPAPIEPPWFHDLDALPVHRRRRWT